MPEHPFSSSIRPVLAGSVVGCVLVASNLYMGLKTSLWDNGAITASILGFALLAGLGKATRRPGTPQENNVVQATAVALGAMPAATGLLGAIPALAALGIRPPSWALICWGIALGLVGLALVAGLRRPLLLEEKLPFPTAVATAEVITAMHSAGRAAFERTRALLASAVASVAVVWLRDAPPRWIPGVSSLPGTIAGIRADALGLGMSWSPMLLGAGALVGARVGLSLLLGALMTWAFLAPLLVRSSVVPGADFTALVSWLTWPGAALMVADALVSLFGQRRAFAATLRHWLGRRAPEPSTAQEPLLAAPLRWGAIVSVLVVVIVGWRYLGGSPAALVVSLGLSVVFAAVAARAAGQTDITPVGSLGQMTQLAVGPGLDGRPAADVTAGAVVAGDCVLTVQGLYAIRSGDILGGKARPILSAQAMGVVIGSVLSVLAYHLVATTVGVGTEAMPAPSSAVWKSVAEVVTRGGSALPPHALGASLVALPLGVILAALERTRAGRFLPSATALGLSMIIPASYSVALCVGALTAAAVRRATQGRVEHLGYAVAAGAIAGESILGIALAMATSLGLLAAP